MTGFYTLTSAHNQTLGIFTSPEKAMEYVYLAEMYQVYRGYKSAPAALVWEDDSGINWYAHEPAEFELARMFRPVARYEIHLTVLDQMPPVENELRAFAERFQPRHELMPVIAYGVHNGGRD